MGSLRYVLLGLLLAAMVFSSCDCNQSDPTVDDEAVFPERKVDFNVDRDVATTPIARTVEPEPTATEAEEEGPSAAYDPRIPDDFPAEIPIYEDAELTQVQPLANQAHNVVFTTSDTVGNVHRYYNDQMTEQGWRVTQQFERDGHAFTTFKKGSTLMNLTIAVDASNPGKQVISIMYEDEQPLPFDEF